MRFESAAVSGESGDFSQGLRADTLTEGLTVVYVFAGVVLLALAIRLTIMSSGNLLPKHTRQVVVVLLCPLGAGLTTFLTRRRVHSTRLFFTPDQNRLVTTDWFAAIQASIFGILGLAAMAVPPSSAEPCYALMLLIMVAALGRELAPPDFSGLRKLAVDEIAIKKNHKYATVVADAERYRVLWVTEDRKEASFA